MSVRKSTCTLSQARSAGRTSLSNVSCQELVIPKCYQHTVLTCLVLLYVLNWAVCSEFCHFTFDCHVRCETYRFH